MGIFKKIWHWLFPKTNEELIKEYSNIKGNEEKALKAQEIYNKVTREREGTKIKGGVNTRPTTPRPNFAPPPQNPSRDFKREADEHFRQQQARRDSEDNFLMGATVGYVIADGLNNNSHRNVEETKSSNYESSYTPSSSSSYDSGSYTPSNSSSYDSGSYSSSSDSSSSSSSCDSGC